MLALQTSNLQGQLHWHERARSVIECVIALDIAPMMEAAPDSGHALQPTLSEAVYTLMRTGGSAADQRVAGAAASA